MNDILLLFPFDRCTGPWLDGQVGLSCQVVAICQILDLDGFLL